MFKPTEKELVEFGFVQKGNSLHYNFQNKEDLIAYCDGEFDLYLKEIYGVVNLYPESVSELQVLIKTLNPR